MLFHPRTQGRPALTAPCRRPCPALTCWGRVLLGWLAWLWLVPAWAGPAPLDLSQDHGGPLGLHLGLWVETADRPDLASVQQANFQASDQAVWGLGIGHRPVWAHLSVDNPGAQGRLLALTVQPSWLDHLEVTIVAPGRAPRHWTTGDAVPGLPGLEDAAGYRFDHEFVPGRSEVYLRVQTADPMLLDVRLRPPATLAADVRSATYLYGALYGFLGALALVNLLMFVGLRRHTTVLYALYLLSYAALNLSYTGIGPARWWPDSPHWQRYVILVLMVLTSSLGLGFARQFLDLARRHAGLARAVTGFTALSAVAMLTLVLLDAQAAAAWLAFAVTTGFVLAMVPLGLVARARGQAATGFFIAGAAISTVGFGLTLFSVWGLVAFSPWRFHASEFGVALEGSLLAAALAARVRRQRSEHQRAEQDARLDALTEVFNRRGFLEGAERAFGTASRHDRPLALVLLDLDHFKALNDSLGHARGDQVLREVGQVLLSSARQGDLVGRWGGEEFIALLPETSAADAAEWSERLRRRLRRQAGPLWITASAGVAQRRPGSSLAALIEQADAALYAAKRAGRDRVALAAAPR